MARWRKLQMNEFINRGTGLLLIDVTNSNPNGDPDRESDPRIRQDGCGEISPVSFKRKLRDLVEAKDSPLWDVYKRQGLSNSSYIYNPINFESLEESTCMSNHALFIGRFSSEKRVNLLVKLFDETIREYKINYWELDLVGMGELSDEVKEIMQRNPHIHYPVSYTHLFMLTKHYEQHPANRFSQQCAWLW